MVVCLHVLDKHLIKIAQRDENHRQWFSIKSETCQLPLPFASAYIRHQILKKQKKIKNTHKTNTNIFKTYQMKLRRPQVIQTSRFFLRFDTRNTCACVSICVSVCVCVHHQIQYVNIRHSTIS